MRFLVLAVAGALACAPAASASALDWSAPQTLAPDVDALGMGMAADGRALVAVSGDRGLDVMHAPAGARFGAPQPIAPAGNPGLAVAPDGAAALAWTSEDGLRFARGTVTGRFGPPVLLDRAVETAPDVLLAADGTALVVADREGGTRTTVAYLIPPGANTARPQVLPGKTVLRNGVATGRDGTLAFATYTSPTRVAVVVRRRGARRLTRLRPARVREPALAVAPDGTVALAGVLDAECGELACHGHVAVAETAPGATRFGPARKLPTGRAKRAAWLGGGLVPSAFAPVIAFSPTGQRLVAWLEDALVDPGAENDSALGRVVVWDGRRRRQTPDRAAFDLTAGWTSAGALVLSDVGRWRQVVYDTRSLRSGPGPADEPSGTSGRRLAASRSRALLVWEGRAGARAAFATWPR